LKYSSTVINCGAAMALLRCIRDDDAIVR
jgi:hypothetical protein